MGANASPTLSVRDLRVEIPARRGTLLALDAVSFSIAPGEILGFVGESGAGKSLTGMAILGLLDPPARIAGGEIHLGERRIDTLSQRAMRRVRGKEIGAIFQDPLMSLNPLLQIGAQLVETMRTHLALSHAQAVQRALALLHAVGIPAPEARFTAYPHQFSGGMRQRIVIALALCAGPRLLLADEPTTALDMSIQAQVLQLLRTLCRENATAMLLVTHDIGVIAEMADRVAVMYAGRIVETGPVEDVLRDPAHPYTRGLMDAIPSIEPVTGPLHQIDGAMPRLNARPTGCAFHPRCARATEQCRAESPGLRTDRQRQVACWVAPAEQEAA
ncbi:ABC transporter ATP-binding protein [Verminephrobacter aporrectodeae]|uniref:ABC transporter ATP-binding protein n=1 Tax=Verminephrobacter aporrectodeae TaxID=1110389 RepID=UPI00224426EB|nr:ABC transporter ATP-binding protein [Verminephrobacter aporrectodeae]MCW8176501.1 ABC transporter ATP-binding protein [Verminephrobacter aporrectodeae subsp. tuberculatae]MCW8204220.1 ABC transporter ATP-binding protein [Verminephrobacter aporrectodeae subsp. tuberculatae]